MHAASIISNITTATNIDKHHAKRPVNGAVNEAGQHTMRRLYAKFLNELSRSDRIGRHLRRFSMVEADSTHATQQHKGNARSSVDRHATFA